MHLAARDSRLSHDALAKKSLDRREPALINLPVAIPSIPIVGPIVTPILNPILTPIIDGPQPSTPTPTPSVNNPAPPASSPTAPNDPPTAPSPSASTGAGGNNGGSNPPNGGGSNNSPGGGGNGNGNGAGGASSSTTTRTGDGAGSAPTPGATGDNNDPNLADGGSHTVGRTLLVNAGSGHTSRAFTTTFETTIFSGGKPIATEIVSSTWEEVDTPGATNGVPGDSPDGKKGPPTGAIAGIAVVVCFLFIGLTVVLIRRRFRARRTERRKWWFARKNNQNERWSAGGSDLATAASGTLSARSSFATTLDHSRTSGTMDFTAYTAPPVPPMAEIRDSHTPGHVRHSQSPIVLGPLITLDGPEEANNRLSVSSKSSDSHHSQYLEVRPTLSPAPDVYSPMSVRPFSPSESFAFPKPPDRRSTHSAVRTVNNADPFSDSQTAAIPAVYVEIVRRPFTPTLHDEIRVDPGEQVRVSKIFDDGWALVEKNPSNSSTDKGKAKAVQGLIPVDCLREEGQDLPSFVVEKRLDSAYSSI